MSGMSLVEGVSRSRAGWFLRFVYWVASIKVRARTGQAKVVGPLKVFAHHTPLLLGYGAFESGLERSNRLPARLKTLASIRAATLVGCAF